jgi:hypothetical protein
MHNPPSFHIFRHDLGAFCEHLTVVFCEEAKEDKDEGQLCAR